MAYTFVCGVLFYYILTYFCPVTFCIPVGAIFFFKQCNFKARFEGTINSIRDKSVFQLLWQMIANQIIFLNHFQCNWFILTDRYLLITDGDMFN